MSDSIYITEDNVVINKSYAYAAKQEEIRPIDMKNKQDILDEIERLTKVRAEYNIHNISPPLHIKRENYTEVSEYKKAKDKYYNDYKTNYNLVNGNINDLQNINTALCRESKKKKTNKKYKKEHFTMRTKKKQRLKWTNSERL